MSASLPEQITAALVEFSCIARLYALTIGAAQHDLLVEAFAAEDQVHEIGFRDVIAVSTDAYIDLSTLLDQPATLEAAPAFTKVE